jgi:hypothetical protein
MIAWSNTLLQDSGLLQTMEKMTAIDGEDMHGFKRGAEQVLEDWGPFLRDQISESRLDANRETTG